jgi:hypothetical protein
MPHKKCLFEGGCTLIASFGYPGYGTKFCSKHKEPKMVNLVSKMCECGRARPIYNYEGLKANFCKECKEDDMINVADKKCFCGRVKPTFNLEGLRPAYCVQCKTPEMIDVYSNRCECGKSCNACFNYKGLKARYCSQCKEDDMVNVIHKKCKCGSAQPSINYEGLVAEYCKKCKEPGMIVVNRRTCIVCLSEQATFNELGKKAEYCRFCKTETMIDIADKCKFEHCVRTGSKKYKYYCTHCFANLFPNDPLTSGIRLKSKENQVRDFLNSNYEGFIHDQPIFTDACDCSHKRRIDHRMLIGNTLLCVETDEFQHRRHNNTNYEEVRYEDLYMIHGGKFIFIRFNPDKYIDKKGKTIETTVKKRLERLKEEVDKQIIRINNEENNELLEIVYLFYDGF